MTPITATATELPEAKAKLEIKVSPDLVEEQLQHAAAEMAERVKIPGFRQGKVPPEIALQRLGREAVFQQAFDEAIGGWYAQALADSGISPIGSPTLAAPPELTEGEPLTFELEVPVRPEAKLNDYEGIEVGRKESEFDASQVDKELDVIRERFATLAIADRPSKEGDHVDIDFTGRVDGEPFEGGAARDYVLQLGSGQFIEGFEEQLVGKSAGDEVNVEVKFPEDYQAEQLAGQDAVFEVKVNAVKEKQLNDLTDEFASENLGYDTVQELRDEIETRLKENSEKEIEREYRWAVVDAVAKQADIEIPHGHIHSRAHELWHDLARTLAQRGMDPNAYLQAVGQSEHDFINSAEGDAEQTIRRESTVAALIEKLDLAVTEDEMIEVISEDMGEGEEKAREQFERIYEAGGLPQLRHEVEARKAIDHLVEHAKPIPIEQAEAREAIWTPEKGEEEEKKAAGGESGLWTPGS
ncbi:MAG TPA: trigger factor [Solirubrobacterales bacterium]|jgi:trigger factor|nr:trigger factor [Solirubrobacterales bacterium]